MYTKPSPVSRRDRRDSSSLNTVIRFGIINSDFPSRQLFNERKPVIFLNDEFVEQQHAHAFVFSPESL